MKEKCLIRIFFCLFFAKDFKTLNYHGTLEGLDSSFMFPAFYHSYLFYDFPETLVSRKSFSSLGTVPDSRNVLYFP